VTSLTTYSTPDSADVVVIGAGVNGLAIGRELAASGLSVVIIDRADVASATSGIATRLIHGGLKYLERFELSLVFESIRERNNLLRTAPHLVRPYPMLIPFLKRASRPGWLLACGILFHDVISVGKRLPLNRLVFGARLRREWPSIAANGVRWGGLFQDANVALLERFNVELAIDAQRRGAVILTHAPVTALVRDEGRIAGIKYQDRESGSERVILASTVINAAGPWVDFVLGFIGEHPRRIGPTKGSHLVIDAFPGAPATCVFFESPIDRRPMFVLPWWGGLFMIGTTDIPFDGDIDELVATDDEVDYLLGSVNSLIASAHLTPDDVLWSMSGVRALPYVADLTDPASVSRESEIVEHAGSEAGLVTIIGGKYTTHRALGEQVLRRIEKRLGRKKHPSTTRTALMPGAPNVPLEEYRADYLARSSLDDRAAARLVDVYGTTAERIEALARDVPALAEVVDPATGAIAAEIVYAVKMEGAVTLEDILVRRTTIGLNRDVGLACAPRAAEVLVAHAGWTPQHAAAALDRYRSDIRRFNPRALRPRREVARKDRSAS